jgi:hypothetical protein
MLKLVSKFAMDIFPSVIATIIGAYIVNHYINNKTPADTAAAVSTADPKKAASRTDSKPAERSADIGNIPEPGVRAKGVPEKAIIDKSAEKPADKPAEKADKPSETASIPPAAPADSRRHQPAGREKAAKVAPAPVPAPAETAAAAPNTAPPAETGPDANDLARAAIERLHRASITSQPPRGPEQARVIAAPAADPAPPPAQVQAPPVPLQPLPPPIMVSTPPADMKPPSPPAPRTGDAQRPTPPADIPFPGTPIDLRADAADSSRPPQGRSSVAEDVLSAAKSVFHSVLPK